MPYAMNGDVRIHYTVEGQGPPLLLHQGFAGCGEDWRDFGYTDALKDRYRLITVDPRGHGVSGKPHDSGAYALSIRAADMTAVLDDLGVARAHYYGHSYGGHLSWALAKYAPERFSSLIISGAHPFATLMGGMRDTLAKGTDFFLGVLDTIYGPWMTPVRRARLADNDLAALTAAAIDRPGLEDTLPSMLMPCLVIAGETDPIIPRIRECLALLPNADFLPLPGCGHVDNYGRTDLVLPAVTGFLARVSG